ncbi:two-component regulator propeller domain-containing protein [Sphingobacterium corticis]|uniref:histidine kinase n=1 Tax=Sphingobacterium corticis TaxID=1812823 RepID=A0ABW5NLE5_9SPHI
MSRICRFSSKRCKIVSTVSVRWRAQYGLYWMLLISLLSFRSVHAQIYFNNFQVANGLSNNAVLCSAQDQDGFLWLGTRHGLNRFDGYNFKTYYANPNSDLGLGSNFIHSLCIGENKEVWVGTDQGLYCFDPYRQTFSILPETKRKEILQIQKDRTGDIWFIANSELYCFRVKTKTLTRKVKSDHGTINRLCIDRHNKVWYGIGSSLISLRDGKKYSLEAGEVWNNRIEKLYVDDQNDIWIGTSRRGLFRYSSQNDRIEHLVANENTNAPLFIRDIAEVDQQQLWMATELGLLIYDRATGQHHIHVHEKDNPWSLSDNALYTITKDHQQGVWVGTFFGGLNYFHQQHNFFEKIFPRNSVNSINGHATREIVEDHYGQIWIGTEDQGLTSWSTETNKFTNLGLADGLSHTNIHGLCIVGDSLLVGTFYKGMDLIDVRTKRVVKSYNHANTDGALGDDFVFSICRTKSGEILLATLRGLYQFFPGSDQFRRITDVPKHHFYTNVFEDKEGQIWLTTWRNGIIRYDRKKGSFEQYIHNPKDKNSLNSNRANRIFQDAQGQIWIGTESGIALWRASSNDFSRITTRDGLPSNLVLGFEEDATNNIWISTSRGLVRMNRQRRTVETFDTEVGILDLQFNYNSSFKDSKGFLYFGSTKGLTRFNPEVWSSLYRTNLVTPIYITGIQSHQRELLIGGTPGNLTRSVTYTDQITLDHDESTISIDFAALNYVSAQATSYRYRLLGLDSAWTFLRKNGKANFTKIPPGRYTFQVLACDASGEPISQEKQLQILIRPPFYASIPAFLIYGLFALGLIGLFFYFYDRNVKEKNRRRLQTIKSHKERQLYEAKMDFFMRVTHEIKTPLTLIKAPLEKINNLAHEEKTQRWLNTIQLNTERLIMLTEQLLDFRKVESEEVSLRFNAQQVSQLIRLCVEEFEPIIENKSIDLQMDLDDALEAKIDVEVIYKIVNNLLSNAFKYADKDVRIRLVRNETTKRFDLMIKNDGVTVSDDDVANIFKPFHRSSAHYQVSGTGLGLALAHSFATLHSGKLKYKTDEQGMNVFVLSIPLSTEE